MRRGLPALRAWSDPCLATARAAPKRGPRLGGNVIDLLKPSKSIALLLLASAAAVTACGSDDGGPATGDEDDLTSITARQRSLSFEAYVYVDASASDSTIADAIKRTSKSALGALRTADISVNNRELN